MRHATFVTDASGAFRFLELAPGPYKLSVDLDGFQTVVREELIVEVGKNVDLAMSLKVAPSLKPSPSSRPRRSSIGEQTGTATNITG